MKADLLDRALALSDPDLLARIEALAGTERESAAELVAHLAALELRPSLYAALGFGSLFHYCTQALRLSEDAACRRIEVARTCRLFPVILELLSSGGLCLTYVRKLSPHLTAENHEAILARARNMGRTEIDALVAELAPQPDVPSSVRKLPSMGGPVPGEARLPTTSTASTADLGMGSAPLGSVAMPASADEGAQSLAPSRAVRPTPRPIVQALAPERYRVQFTIGQETHDKLSEMQALLRRQVPSGDPGAIFDLALDALREKVEKARFGSARRPASDAPRTRPTYETRIRSSADEGPGSRSRHIAKKVKRAVWRRDGGQCAFVADGGRRCDERSFLEFHHIQPYALDGAATAGNISLRCRRHNAYEAELVFGPREVPAVGEERVAYA